MRDGVQLLAQELMDAEVTDLVGAEPPQRTAGRTTYRNGYREPESDPATSPGGLRLASSRSWSTLDRELLDDAVFINRAAARLAVFNYIESSFNPWRPHSSIGMPSPAKFERARRAKKDQEVVA